MQQQLVFQALVDKKPNSIFLALSWIFSSIIWSIIVESTLGYLNGTLLILCGVVIFAIPIIIVFYRFNQKKKCLVLEAMGEYEKSITLAARYADPQLIKLFRQRYAMGIKQETTPQLNQANNIGQNPSVINIQNVLTQQGPTEISVQDSVVTDWNHR